MPQRGPLWPSVVLHLCHGPSEMLPCSYLVRGLTLSLLEWMKEFCKVALTFMSVDKSHGVTIQMKSLWKYVHVVLYVFKNFTKWNLGFLSNLPFVTLAVKGLIQDIQWSPKTAANWSQSLLYWHPLNAYTSLLRTVLMTFGCLYWRDLAGQCLASRRNRPCVLWIFRERWDFGQWS